MWRKLMVHSREQQQAILIRCRNLSQRTGCEQCTHLICLLADSAMCILDEKTCNALTCSKATQVILFHLPACPNCFHMAAKTVVCHVGVQHKGACLPKLGQKWVYWKPISCQGTSSSRTGRFDGRGPRTNSQCELRLSSSSCVTLPVLSLTYTRIMFHEQDLRQQPNHGRSHD